MVFHYIDVSYLFNQDPAIKHFGDFQTFSVVKLVTIFLYIYIRLYGEGSGTPLQYSCLGNPMDGGAW